MPKRGAANLKLQLPLLIIQAFLPMPFKTQYDQARAAHPYLYPSFKLTINPSVCESALTWRVNVLTTNSLNSPR